MKNKRWVELQSLQRHRSALELNGQVNDQSLDRKIDGLKDDIRREALMQQDEQAETQTLSRKELIRLMEVYGLVIHARDFVNWRPTQRTLGDITGVAEGLTIIATNGLLGYFVDLNNQPLCGHVDWFVDGDGEKIEVKPLFSSSSRTSSKETQRKPKRRLSQEKQARELLRKLTT